ncbi:hypothetical protein BH09BAC6_BH09BAC6_04730 [soil metagenome]
MPISNFINQQDSERAPLMQAIHDTITKNDTTVEATIGSMMGKEMILYKDRGFFKYGLASVKDYMSLHVLPIYGHAPLHAKYLKLLPEAKFQKGCINFKNETEMPVEVVGQLIADCAPIDLLAMREKYLSSKKKR